MHCACLRGAAAERRQRAPLAEDGAAEARALARVASADPTLHKQGCV